MRVCARCGQENPDVARFCLACGTPLTAAAAPAEERKLVTVLFTDIVGSTASAEQLDPEDVRARLAPYYARARQELVRFGGTVEKFIGDAVVALFGAPTAHEDDPERAVRAALALRDAIAELNAADEWLDLKVRIGVNTGEALVVVGARTTEGEGMAAGDVMNTAARLQSAAPVNGILVGGLTYRATRGSIRYREREPVAAKGKAEPVPVWEAVGVLAERDASPRRRTPLVGREPELDRLREVWTAAASGGGPRLAIVVGAPGVGKSRLASEFARAVARGGSVHRGRCLAYGEGITYWPVTEVVKSAAGILQSDSREEAASKLDRFLDTLGTSDADELRTIAAALSNLLGIPTTPRGTYSAVRIGQAELHWGIRRMLELLAHRRPLLVVLEDVHWAEPTLLELVEHVLGLGGDAPLMVLCSSRPELADSAPAFLASGGRRTTIALGTLDSEQAAALLAGLVGDPELAETPFAAALIENAGGNPLFLEETVHMLRDEGLVDLERWRAGGADGLPVPTSVHALISSRLDRLAGNEKRLAHDASVVGTVFWAGAVAHLGRDDGAAPEDPRPGLAMLARQDFVHPEETSTVAGEDEYAFNHALIRDVAYGQVPKGRRAQLHVRFSDWVATLPGGADDLVEIVAWHLEQACRLSREVARSPIEPPLLTAAQALAVAARRAEQREGMQESHRYYARALEVLGDRHPGLALELRLRLGDITLLLGRAAEARELLTAVGAQAAAGGRDEVLCESALILADIDQRQGRASGARQRLQQAESLALRTGNRALQVRIAFLSAAMKHDFEGDAGALDDLRGAVALAGETGDRSLLAEGHLRVSALLMNLGRYAEAQEELARCLGVAGEMGSRKVEAEATAWLGGVKYYLGEREEGKRLGRNARKALERTGDSYFAAQNLIWLAAHCLLEGHPEEAEADLRDALPVALELGGWIVLQTYRYLVEALVAQRRPEEARELVAFAARSLPEEDSYARSELLRAEASVATACGEGVAAAAAFSEALRLLEGLNLHVEVAETRIELARSLHAFGDLGGARTAYRLARSAFARMGFRTFVELADRELAEIDERAGPAGPLVVA